jgi:hypothetical protein
VSRKKPVSIEFPTDTDQTRSQTNLCLGAASTDPITICGGVKEREKVEKDHAWIPDLINGMLWRVVAQMIDFGVQKNYSA